MANDWLFTTIAELIENPVLRESKSNGVPFTKFLVRCTPYRWSKLEGQYVDGESIELPAVCWSHLANNVAASLKAGDKVVIYGKYVQRTRSNPDGTKQQWFELHAEECSPSLRHTSVTLPRDGEAA